MNKVKVFQYKGIVGIDAMGSEIPFIVKIGGGNLGCMVNTKDVVMSRDAYNILKSLRKGQDDLGDVECIKASDGSKIFGWLGGPLRMIIPSKSEVSIGYDISLIKPVDEVSIPKDFIDYIEQSIPDGDITGMAMTNLN